MTKLEFITKQLAKAQNKKYEHYVVNRIWNLLNDLRVKFVTQQFVTRPEGRALTDMFFPQLEIHVEVDEGFHKNQIDADKMREADIINATGHQILRVDVTKDLEQINQKIDEIVNIIKNKIESSENFKPWDLDMEQNPQTYIDKGYIDVKDDAAFRTMADAASCFGKKYKNFQNTYIFHPVETNKRLSFPKFFENDKWNNQLSSDEKTITEICKIPEKIKEHVDWVINNNPESRIIFAKVKSPLGDTMYRFKGEYKLDLEATNYENGLVWRRISTHVKTYPHQIITELIDEQENLTNVEEFYQQKIFILSEKEQLELVSLITKELSKKS